MRRPIRLWLRSPTVHWAVAGCLAVVTIGTLQTRSSDLDRRERSLAPMIAVAVATGDHDAGEALGSEDAAMAELPASMVADDALRRLPTGERLSTAVADGEVLTRRRFADGHPSALAAIVPTGWRALALPLPPTGLDLTAGDRVDLLALTSAGKSDVIVTSALVLAAADDSATVAVPRGDAGAVADAALAATLTVVLVGPTRSARVDTKQGAATRRSSTRRR